LDFSAAMVILLVEMTVGILSYVKWLRSHGELDRVKTGFFESIISHRNAGSLDEYIQDFITGKFSISRKRKCLSTALHALASVAVGSLMALLVFRLFSLGLLVKTIVGTLLMVPSAYLLAVAIAEESDENAINRFEKAVREQLSSAKENGTVEAWVAEFSR